MSEIEEFKQVIKRLRAEDGCPWDREQTHSSLKGDIMEEAAEVICGINVYEETGNAESMMDELGDLLLQIVMESQIASEEGLFDFEDVARRIAEKVKSRIGFTPIVKVVEIGVLPRSMKKTARVIDERYDEN